MRCFVLVVALFAGLLVIWAEAAVPTYSYRVVAKYPHSTESYTEGFFYLDGMFYEGTGLTGHSSLMAIDPQTGQVNQRHDLPAPYFGEGIADWGPNLYDLAGLLPPDQKVSSEAVLNGIAYDKQHDRLFVTGKQWPTIFEIKLVSEGK